MGRSQEPDVPIRICKGAGTEVAFEKSGRKKHKYRLGLEVLRDMHTLAMCDGLVVGISQVAVCDKGINRNCREFRK